MPFLSETQSHTGFELGSLIPFLTRVTVTLFYFCSSTPEVDIGDMIVEVQPSCKLAKHFFFSLLQISEQQAVWQNNEIWKHTYVLDFFMLKKTVPMEIN